MESEEIIQMLQENKEYVKRIAAIEAEKQALELENQALKEQNAMQKILLQDEKDIRNIIEEKIKEACDKRTERSLDPDVEKQSLELFDITFGDEVAQFLFGELLKSNGIFYENNSINKVFDGVALSARNDLVKDAAILIKLIKQASIDAGISTASDKIIKGGILPLVFQIVNFFHDFYYHQIIRMNLIGAKEFACMLAYDFRYFCKSNKYQDKVDTNMKNQIIDYILQRDSSWQVSELKTIKSSKFTWYSNLIKKATGICIESEKDSMQKQEPVNNTLIYYANKQETEGWRTYGFSLIKESEFILKGNQVIPPPETTTYWLPFRK